MTAQLDLLEALQQRDTGIARVTVASDDQDIAVVDQAIREVAARGVEFTSYDIRPLLPVLRSMNLIGARIREAGRRGEIRKLRHEPCKIPSSHGRVVAVWQAVV